MTLIASPASGTPRVCSACFHPDAGNAGNAAKGKILRQLENSINSVSGGQPHIGVATDLFATMFSCHAVTERGWEAAMRPPGSGYATGASLRLPFLRERSGARRGE